MLAEDLESGGVRVGELAHDAVGGGAQVCNLCAASFPLATVMHLMWPENANGVPYPRPGLATLRLPWENATAPQPHEGCVRADARGGTQLRWGWHLFFFAVLV